jgi:hypothetical protein
VISGNDQEKDSAIRRISKGFEGDVKGMDSGILDGESVIDKAGLNPL